MAANTKIQFRRGYSTNYNGSTIAGRPTPLSSGFKWAETSVLSEGEIGYEIDTGKFKIGKYIDGTLGSWASLPYAGGSSLIAQTGIGFTFDEASNAYTLYSFITGVAGGQDGITFETIPLSNFVPGAQGSGYRIGLSSKLENLHDSLFSFNNNLLASTNSVGGTGIVISGYNNSTIALNPYGGMVTASGIDIRNLTAPITVTEAVGGLAKGITLTNASGITEVLRTMLEKIFEPTVPTNDQPKLTISFSSTPGSVSNGGNIEAGTSGNVTISASFNQGIVRGTGIGAGWDTNGNQGVRAGAATSYTINNNNNGLSTSFNVGTVTVVDGTTTYGNHSVSHATGIVPKNSIGANSTSLTQLDAGLINGNSVSFNGRRNLFYGTSTSVLDPPSSGFIRSLTPILNPSLSTSFSIVAPVDTRTIVVAVPSGSSYGSIANGNFNVVNNGTNLAVTDSFSFANISIPGANGYNPIAYKVWYFINSGPLEASTTYNVKLN